MSYTEEKIQEVWEKGTVVSSNDPNIYRKDKCGAWIARKQYGNRDSTFGWEIDHIKVDSKGGGEELSNLRPLQWENNVAKSDGRLSCVVVANGIKNIKKN